MVLRDLLINIGFNIDSSGLNPLDNKISALKKNILGLNPAMIGLASSTAFFIKSAGDLEQVRILFDTVFQSADKSKRVIDDIKSLTEETTFTFEELLRSSRLLLAAQVSPEKFKDTLRILADLASGVSGSIERFAFLFNRIKSAGALTGIVRRLAETSGLPLTPILVEDLGKTQDEIDKLVRGRKITTEIIVGIFKKLTSEGGIFFQAAIRQAKTFLGVLSVIRDRLDIIGKDIGEKLLPRFKILATRVNNFLTANKKLITLKLVKFYSDFIDAVSLGTTAFRDITFFALEALKPLKEMKSLIPFLTQAFKVWVSLSIIRGFTTLTLSILSMASAMLSFRKISKIAFGLFFLDLIETFEGKDTVITKLLDMFREKFPKAFDVTEKALDSLSKKFNAFFSANQEKFIALSALIGFVLTPGGLTGKAKGAIAAAALATVGFGLKNFFDKTQEDIKNPPPASSALSKSLTDFVKKVQEDIKNPPPASSAPFKFLTDFAEKVQEKLGIRFPDQDKPFILPSPFSPSLALGGELRRGLPDFTINNTFKIEGSFDESIEDKLKEVVDDMMIKAKNNLRNIQK